MCLEWATEQVIHCITLCRRKRSETAALGNAPTEREEKWHANAVNKSSLVQNLSG